MNGTVVVGVGGTPADLDALDAATDEAVRRSSTLLIAYASDVSPPGTGPAAVMDAAARARGRSKALRIETRGEAEPAGPYLTRLSGSAALLVVGSSESSGLVGLLTGSVSAYVAAHARCPVLVVRADSALTQAPESPGTIVVGISPDHPAEASIDFAVENAALRQVDVRIVIATSGLSDAQRSHATRLVDKWESARPAVAFRAEQVDLSPDEALISASEEAGLLVIGTCANGGRLDDDPGVRAIDLPPQRIMVGTQVANCPQCPSLDGEHMTPPRPFPISQERPRGCRLPGFLWIDNRLPLRTTEGAMCPYCGDIRSTARGAGVPSDER